MSDVVLRVQHDIINIVATDFDYDGFLDVLIMMKGGIDPDEVLMTMMFGNGRLFCM